MRSLALCLVLLVGAQAAEDQAALKTITRAIREGDQESLAGLQQQHGPKAAQLVREAVSSKRVGGGIKARLAEIVTGWPKDALGRQELVTWLAKHPNCEDDAMLFFAEIHPPEARSWFWSQIEATKGEPAKLRNPQRIAMAVRGLGFFEDNPELVVTRIASMLAAEFPHVIRACAADALGGMRHAQSIEALILQVEDAAIGSRVVRSLYRLTGQHFENELATRWQEWWQANKASVPFKMHALAEFDEFLKLQALVKPVDDTMIDMETFYGVKVDGNGLLFILDVSGSMTIGGRINKLRAQMGNILLVLEGRPARLHHGILTFSDSVESCYPRGIALNEPANRQKAAKFIERLDADGGTSMVSALRHAAEKVLPDANLDTIYLLSDGSPTDGSDQMVLDAARLIHQRHQCHIHTIAIGEDQPAAFGEKTLMEQVAGLTGGTFTRVRDVEDGN